MKPRGPKDRFTVVPWKNSEWFNRVYNDVFNDSLTRKKAAVDDICVWDTRCHPSLPTAVEATLGIVRAICHDMLCQTLKSFYQEGDIQMLYCMALIRFVNLTLEHHQKAVGKIRMSLLATKHNIPTWLIDLRNEAVHEFYPSLPMLRLGADKALRYLEETFWSKEALKIKPKINLPSLREAEIVDLLNQYKSLQFQRVESEKLTRSQSKDLKAVLKKIGVLLRREKEKFISVLVQPGNFIATEDIKRLTPIDGPFLADDVNLCVPWKMQKFWCPLLRKIHQNELMPMFLERLLLAQEKCSNKICQKTAIAWVQHILTATDSKRGFLLSKCFQKRGLLLNFQCLIYACLKGATPYSPQLLSTILKEIGRKEIYNSLFFLMALSQGKYVPKEEPGCKRKRDLDQEFVHSVEDVEIELTEVKAKKMRAEKDVNVWSTPSVTMDFSDIPIGGILNPSFQDADKAKQSAEDSWMELIKLAPSEDDNFIIVNKNDGEGTVEEEITHDINTFPLTTRPENFDMIYRRKPNQ